MDSKAAEIVIYNFRGKQVNKCIIQDSIGKFIWDGKNLNGIKCTSGLYYVRIKTNTKNYTHKVVLLK